MANVTLIPQTTLAAAGTITGDAKRIKRSGGLGMQSKLVVAGGGTTCKVFVQTSLDNGTTWFDIASHAFTTSTATKVSAVSTRIAPASQGLTPGDAALTDNTIIQGVLGSLVRAKVVTTGTFTGASHITVTAESV